MRATMVPETRKKQPSDDTPRVEAVRVAVAAIRAVGPLEDVAREVVDATGAGDAFAGGFLAGLVTHRDVNRALEQGIVSASFAIEDWGGRGLMAATPAVAAERHAEWFADSTAEVTA